MRTCVQVVESIPHMQAFDSSSLTPLATAPQFANLWPLARNAAVEVERRVLDGQITRAEGETILDFANKGFIVLEKAIEPELIGALVGDVRNIGQHPGRFLTTAHRHGKTYGLSGPDFDSYESIFDTYVNLESARRVCLHPKITRLLHVLFEEAPLAFQQLLFQRSNQHPIHQDTSVVCVEEPLLMVATWIALEDVVPGRGELTYWEGSHRIPQYIFKDGSRRLIPSTDDPEASRAYLREQCERLGCKKSDFIAKKGDLLFWAADLVHASNPRTRPDHETRMALVTHYCPKSVRPFWMRFLPNNRSIQPGASDGFIASQYYRLPATGLIEPNFEIV